MITAEELREYRERTGMGLLDAKRALTKERLLQELAAVRKGSVEDKLDFILDYIESKETPRHPMTGALITFP